MNISNFLLFSALFFATHGDMWAMEVESKATEREFEEKHQDQGGRCLVDDQGNTLLHKAAAQGKLKSVKRYIQMGVPVDAKNVVGEMPFDLAKKARHGGVCKFLKANLDLLKFAYDGNFYGVKRALKAGADPNVRNRAGNTPLLGIAQIGTAEEVRYLLDAGARFNDVNSANRTPLFLAACIGNVGVVRQLLAAGADKTIVDENGQTALDIARKNGRKRTAALLEG